MAACQRRLPFLRGHGAQYDALAARQIDEAALAALLTGMPPELARQLSRSCRYRVSR
jgi:hypothetical protein